MIDLYFWTTPNGYKPLLFLEETGLPYAIRPVDIGVGEQFEPAFLEISPNNRIPAIVDNDPGGGEAPNSVFESGAILQYLAEKSGTFLPGDLRGRTETLQWLNWQIGGLGPMLGQNLHFSAYAPEELPYAIGRYANETMRLYRVLDKRLKDRPFVAGEDYTIADMAIYPWVLRTEREREHLGDFPHLDRWYRAVAARPATISTYTKGAAINTQPTVTEESKKILLGQTGVQVAA
ncbi:MAG: glutathione S-transferase N-terminal domain-containing protein [Alphaproteobacteria bacterium]|jgi:GST-like protein|nr:glutathione S-transferase N-terminal domain-containing protein [Alphaproteobacteria bacterium]